MSCEDRIYEENTNKQGLKMKIIEYRTYLDIDVIFDDGNIINTRYDHFKEGSVKNPYFPSVLGIGYIGNTITIDDNKKPLKSYTIWKSMLQRCYDSKSTSYKKYGGDGVTVCEEWKCYAIFKEWYDEHYYEVNNEKMAIDKDILNKGNKIYSPKNCMIVPERINSLFAKRASKRGNYPIGVAKGSGKKYVVRFSINDKLTTIGSYATPEEAFYVYKEAKEKEIKRVADKYKDKIPQKLYEAMYNYEIEIDD